MLVALFILRYIAGEYWDAYIYVYAYLLAFNAFNITIRTKHIAQDPLSHFHHIPWWVEPIGSAIGAWCFIYLTMDDLSIFHFASFILLSFSATIMTHHILKKRLHWA